jgi:hypothetical protein
MNVPYDFTHLIMPSKVDPIIYSRRLDIDWVFLSRTCIQFMPVATMDTNHE